MALMGTFLSGYVVTYAKEGREFVLNRVTLA